MDKYQSYVLKNVVYKVMKKTEAYEESEISSRIYRRYRSDSKMLKQAKEIEDYRWKCVVDTGNKIIIPQDENYNITKYVVRFNKGIEIVKKVLLGDNEYNVSKVNIDVPVDNEYNVSKVNIDVPVDFNNKMKEMELYFNAIDPIKIPIEYKEVDKKVYDAKVEKERIAGLIAEANIKVSTGTDLVNIYFKPVTAEYERTEISLYDQGSNLLGNFKVDEGMYFKSITGLAYGKYYVKLIQYAKGDKEIFSSDKIEFVITRPEPPPSSYQQIVRY